MKNVSRYNCQVVLYATRCLDFFEVYFNVLLSKLRIKSVSKLVYSYFRTNRTISGPAGQSSRNIRKSKGHTGSLKSGFSWPLEIPDILLLYYFKMDYQRKRTYKNNTGITQKTHCFKGHKHKPQLASVKLLKKLAWLVFRAQNRVYHTKYALSLPRLTRHWPNWKAETTKPSVLVKKNPRGWVVEALATDQRQLTVHPTAASWMGPFIQSPMLTTTSRPRSMKKNWSRLQKCTENY